MLNWYYRFCCSVHSFFERRMKYRDAEIFTFFFTALLLYINSFTIFMLIEYLWVR